MCEREWERERRGWWSAFDGSADTSQLQVLTEMSEAVNVSLLLKGVSAPLFPAVFCCFLCASSGTSVNLTPWNGRKQTQQQQCTTKYLSTITVQGNRAATQRYKLMLLGLQLMWEIHILFACLCILAQACIVTSLLTPISQTSYPIPLSRHPLFCTLVSVLLFSSCVTIHLVFLFTSKLRLHLLTQKRRSCPLLTQWEWNHQKITAQTLESQPS